MRYTTTLLATVISLVWSAQSSAAPVELDTPSTHIIVVRPVDAWSGDVSVSEDSLDAVRDRVTHYGVVAISTKTGKSVELYGGAGMFGGVADHPITRGVQTELLKKNMKLAKNGKSVFRVLDPIAINPEDMAAIAVAQTEFYKQFVISQGDPETLSGKVRVKKLIGGVAALGATLFAMDKFGAVAGSSATLGSGITNDIYSIATKNRGALSPINLPNVDFTQFKSVDVRKVVGAADRMGQVIIAYKEDKTPEAEEEALIKAIVTLTGADTTPAEVEKSRALDLANRRAIWSACLAESKCQSE